MSASNLENAHPHAPLVSQFAPAPAGELPKQSRRGWGFLLFAATLVLLFHRPLLDLWRYCSTSDIFSYVPLVPLMSGYLIWLKRAELASSPFDGWRPGVWLASLGGAAILIGWWGWPLLGGGLTAFARFGLPTVAFLLFLVGGFILFFGGKSARAVAFPLALLGLMIPLPTVVTNGLSAFLQHASAEVSYWLLNVAGEPVLRNGLVFQLSGITIRVAEECSGIRSSLVLLITSLLSGYLFLSRPRWRLALVLAAIPLGILRNGLRIFLISVLCTHLGPEMIDSPLHHRGGPLFFALSMVFLGGLLMIFRKIERTKEANGKDG
jgi:exosortase C (VPDSG-CTERM-specific)